MKKYSKKKEFQIWAFFSITVVIAWVIVVWMLYGSHTDHKEAFLDLELKRYEGEVNSTLVTYETFSNYIFDELNQDDELLSIVHQANSASDEEKEILRKRLYDKLSEKYLTMKNYEFRQFHFHLPNTESFLRVHSPDKYGDLLLDSRESVRLANENLTKIVGFEEGKIFNGFRNVYPLQYDNEHIGSVEISMSSASIIEILAKLYISKDFYFIIDQSVVKETLFEDELVNYSNSNILDDYYVDIEVDQFTSTYNTVSSSSQKLFFQGVEKQCQEQLRDKESFSTIYKFNGGNYAVKFLAIKNFKNEPVAYLISVSDCVKYNGFFKEMYQEVILVTLLSLLMIIFGLVLSFYQFNLKNSAELDYLTNIYNRNKFYQLVEREIKGAKRYDWPISVMLIDIDLFKIVNDTYGHEWGDQVLKKLASKILSNIRDIDIFARWGGEEFVLLLPSTGKEGGLIAAEKIRKLIDECQSKELKGITISIGVSTVNPENYDIDAAIKLADEAMYEAKTNGRNQVCFK